MPMGIGWGIRVGMGNGENLFAEEWAWFTHHKAPEFLDVKKLCINA